MINIFNLIHYCSILLFIYFFFILLFILLFLFDIFFFFFNVYFKAIVHQSAKPNDELKNYEMETLRKQINDYVTEINQLKTVVQKLSTENTELKSKFSTVQQPSTTASNTSVYDEPL